MAWYLMIKKVRQNGFKYLCKCADNKNHITYKGSGTYWRKILDQHPEYIIDTEVLGYYESKEELKQAGIFYSQKYDVVRSREWANCIPETGDGGSTTNGRIGIYNPITLKEKFILKDEEIPLGWLKGRKPKGPRPAEVTARIVAAQRGQVRSDAVKTNMKNAKRKKRKTLGCCFCSRQITPQNIKRHMEKTHGKVL